MSLLPFALNLFKHLNSPISTWWKDGYGWWENAFVKAINSRSQLGYAGPSNDQLFKDILAAAQSCWQQLLGNWRDKDPYTSYRDNAAASAAISKGTFNHAPPPDDPIFPMSGRNCVTNESFWILSEALPGCFPQTQSIRQQPRKNRSGFSNGWIFR